MAVLARLNLQSAFLQPEEPQSGVHTHTADVACHFIPFKTFHPTCEPAKWQSRSCLFTLGKLSPEATDLPKVDTLRGVSCWGSKPGGLKSEILSL